MLRAVNVKLITVASHFDVGLRY